MELSDVTRRRRMVRSFSGRPVPPGVLDHILEVACSAPSAGNTHGWDVIVLAGPAETAVFWEATTTEGWRARSRRWPGLSRAPVVVALFVDEAAYLARYREADKAASGLGQERGVPIGGPVPVSDGVPVSGSSWAGGAAWPVPYWFVDGGFAALLVLLAATDAGLGACFLGNFRGEEDLRAALGVPDDRRYLGAVLVGEAGGDDPPSMSAARGRRRPSEVIHRGRW
ncbi:MAG TPA: nitroreductase family protein [Acidimicrobiales bacterium]|nr:nitroreductase family protein [Acidimicrobiales bacterium]